MLKKSILVVEDDQTIREALKLFLEVEGFDVLTAGDGQQALDTLSRSPIKPRLILLDLMMPIMDGYEFLSQRLQNSELKTIPVVAVSAFSSPSEELGAQGFVKKPVDLHDLMQFVERFCA